MLMKVSDNALLVEEAYDDLLRRTLSKIQGDLAQLIYLASTRDYNTGQYRHDGLAARFGEEISGQALNLAHRETFRRLAGASLEQVVKELDLYLSHSQQSREDILQVWQKLEPYRVALPVNVNVALGQLFISNVKIALTILRRQEQQAAASES
jgi:hypothetical protein